MAIVKELFSKRKDGVKLYRIYSDKAVKIKQMETGRVYNEAIDVESASYTYTETDTPIETEPLDETEEKARAYDIIVGGDAQ